MTGGTDDRLMLVARRAPVIDLLTDGPWSTRDIVDGLDSSRSTVNRALRELTDAGFVRRDEDGYVATFAGRLALDRYRSYERESAAVVDGQELLNTLPVDCDLGIELLVGADYHVDTTGEPYRLSEELRDLLENANGYRAVLPALNDVRRFRLYHEHVVTDGTPVELVVSPDLLDRLREAFPRRLPNMAAEPSFELFAGDTPSYGLLVTDAPDGRVATAIVLGSDEVCGYIRNDSEAAVEWAERRFERARDGARRVESEAADGYDRSGRDSPLPPALQREGFRRLDREFFLDVQVADPSTAWRSGLGLGEVHTGYAVERTVEVDGEERPMTETLIERLDDGRNVVVVGPPGSGKSTICKRVACRWYETDRGPVLYREGGRGRPLESTDDLVTAVEDCDGRPLVVVEDAPSPESAAVFDAIDALDRAGATVLSDARSSEWRDPPAAAELPPDYADPVTTVRMPRLLGADCDRLFERFEDTVGTEVPGDEIREAVLSDFDDAGETARPGEPLLLLHRLATYAETTGDGASRLAEDVESVVDTLRAAGDVALDVGIAVNAMNAAGVPVTEGLIRAVAPDDPDRVEEALDALDGRVLFGRENGRYRTIHEWWSVEFLAALLDADGVSAPERFGRCFTRVLLVAEEPTARTAAERGPGATDPALSRASASPDEWVEETVRRLYSLGRDRPKLSALYGTPSEPTVELPRPGPDDLGYCRLLWQGEAYLRSGAFEHAEEAFETLVSLDADASLDADTAEQLRVAARYQLGKLAQRRGDLDAAEDHARRCLELTSEGDFSAERARARDLLGIVANIRGEYETAAAEYGRALATFRAVGDRLGEAETLDHLGILSRKRGALADAVEYHESALEMARELGDEELETKALHNLGTAEKHRGNLGAAADRFRRALDYYRTVGNRRAVAYTIGSLAEIERKRGDFDATAEHAERAVELLSELGDKQGEARARKMTGVAAKYRGDLGAATDAFERARALAAEVGVGELIASCDYQLGDVALRRGDLDEARRYVESSIDRYRELDNPVGAAHCRVALAEIATAEGEPERARELVEPALETVREHGESYEVAEVLETAARSAREHGDEARAREYLTEAAERYAGLAAVGPALDAIDALVEVCESLDDTNTAVEWCERAVELADGTVFQDRRSAFDDRTAEFSEGAVSG